jgi:hypothetical protein
MLILAGDASVGARVGESEMVRAISILLIRRIKTYISRALKLQHNHALRVKSDADNDFEGVMLIWYGSSAGMSLSAQQLCTSHLPIHALPSSSGS